MGDERGQLSSGGKALVSEMVPHNIRNVVTVTAKLIGFFASANVISTFKETFQQNGMRVIDIAKIPMV